MTNINNFSISDPVKWSGCNKNYPVDSFLARNFLSENNLYIIEKTNNDEIQLKGINIPFTYHIFKKVYN